VFQEEYIKEEQRNLKRELLRAEEEVKRIQSVPLFIGQFLEMVDANSGVVSSTTGTSKQHDFAPMLSVVRGQVQNWYFLDQAGPSCSRPKHWSPSRRITPRLLPTAPSALISTPGPAHVAVPSRLGLMRTHM
jgi:hypothetical protein